MADCINLITKRNPYTTNLLATIVAICLSAILNASISNSSLAENKNLVFKAPIAAGELRMILETTGWDYESDQLTVTLIDLNPDPKEENKRITTTANYNTLFVLSGVAPSNEYALLVLDSNDLILASYLTTYQAERSSVFKVPVLTGNTFNALTQHRQNPSRKTVLHNHCLRSRKSCSQILRHLARGDSIRSK